MLKFCMRLTVLLTVLSVIVSVGGRSLPLNDDCIHIYSEGVLWLVDVNTGQAIQTKSDYEWTATQPQGEAILRLYNEDARNLQAVPLMLKSGDSEKVIDDSVWVAAWSNSGEYIVYVSGDQTVGLANSDGEILKRVRSSISTARAVPLFSADDAYVLITGYDDGERETFFYAVPDLTLVEYEGSDSLRFGPWSPAGHTLTGFLDSNFILFSPETGVVTSDRQDIEEFGIRAVWSPDGEFGVIAGKKIPDVRGQHYYFLDLIDLHGKIQPDAILPRMFLMPTSEEDLSEFFIWDADNTLLVWRGTPETSYELVRYDPRDESIAVIAAGFVRPVKFMDDGRWTAAWREGYDLVAIEVATGREVRLLANLPKAPLTYIDYPYIFWSENYELWLTIFDENFGWINLATGVSGQSIWNRSSHFAGWEDAIFYTLRDENQRWQVIKVDLNTNEQTILLDDLLGASLDVIDDDRVLVYWSESASIAGIDVWESSESAARRLLYPLPRSSQTDNLAHYGTALSPDQTKLIVRYPHNNLDSAYLFTLDGSQPVKWIVDGLTVFPRWNADSSRFALIMNRESVHIYDQDGELKSKIDVSDLQLGGSELEWETCR